MATKAGDMILTASAPALAQWLPADGRYIYGYQQQIVPARPHTGPSQGWVRDYWRNVHGFARTRGIGGFMIGLPVAATYSVSVADDSGDTTVPTNTVQRPPAGTK
jgi:hypothetical protein